MFRIRHFMTMIPAAALTGPMIAALPGLSRTVAASQVPLDVVAP
jgi:hypothetical protein